MRRFFALNQKMSRPNENKRTGENTDQITNAPTSPKKHKHVPKGSLTRSPFTAKKHLQMKSKDLPQLKPTTNDEISSNWKAFWQATPSAQPAPVADSRRRRRGLAKRGCSCPPAVWFDGVDPDLLQTDRQPCDFCRRQRDKADLDQQRERREHDKLAKTKTPLPSRYLAMDCEMVGVGHNGQENMLARVSIVNSLCQPVYDKFVKPKERVTDYRTSVSGVRPKDLVHAETFEVVQKEVAALLKGRVMVGHAVHNDLKVLLLSHPKRHTRDTASYKPFRRMFNGSIPSLKNLAHKILAVDIQKGEHDSVQDARATMQLYQTHRREWESAIAERHHRRSVKTDG